MWRDDIGEEGCGTGKLDSRFSSLSSMHQSMGGGIKRQLCCNDIAFTFSVEHSNFGHMANMQ